MLLNNKEYAARWRERNSKLSPKKRVASLSKRELEVAKMVVGEAYNKEISDALGISIKSVEYYRYVAYAKLGANHPIGIFRTLARAGVVKL